MNKELIREKLKDILKKTDIFQVKIFEDESIDIEQLDSIEFVQLLLILEKEFSIEIEIEEFDISYMKNLDEIVSFIYRKSNGLQEEKTVYFYQRCLNNTDVVRDILKKEYLNGSDAGLIIASTTGETAQKIYSSVSEYDISIIVCKQNLNEKLYMTKEMESRISSFAKLYDIPSKYLRKKVGNLGVEILRSTSQGYKVCCEMMEYLNENNMLELSKSYLVVAGTVKGADTVVEFFVNKNGKIKLQRFLTINKR